MAMAAAISAAAHKTETPLRYLTKSLVRTALKCPRKVVYATNPSLYPRNKEHVEDPLLQHLSQEGDRFGEYCKRLFPHGVEIGKHDVSAVDAASKRQNGARISSSPTCFENLVTKTHHTLMDEKDENERITVFEGAIRHGFFYVQPDILDKVVKPGSGQTELRVIEVKSKSWDSRHTVESKMLNAKKKSIKSLFLPYIQDVAFQSMVCRLMYPDLKVSSWLMMPDRAKNMKCSPGHDMLIESSGPMGSILPSLDETIHAIDDSIATLMNVDELVEIALTSEVTYPGGMKGETFKDAAQRWAEELNDATPDSFSTPIGLQCSSCEYRLNDPSERTYSGFHNCWKNATSIETEELRQNPLVVDLYGNTKAMMKIFLSKKKILLSDLSAIDFDLEEDGTLLEDGAPNRKKERSGHTITKCQRQWYQVQTNKRSTVSNTNVHPNYVIKRNGLEQEMKTWRYPLHFIDFETVAPAVPFYPNMSPYEIFAFQFSHHILDKKSDGSLQLHHASEFLHTERGPPNVAFLKALVNAIGSTVDVGTTFQWSPHETHVLRSMLSSQEVSSSLSSQDMSTLSAICGNKGMVDLCKLARKYYYVDGSGGSSSIKRLLKSTINASDHLKTIYSSPTYNGMNFSNMQWCQLDDSGCAKDPYDILSNVNPSQHDIANVTKGGAAAAAFHSLQNLDLSSNERKAIENSLLRYCELDTLAMAMIVQAWQGFLSNEE